MRRVQILAMLGATGLLWGQAPTTPLAAISFSDWSVPENLGPVVNSPFADSGPALSKDGLSLYFSSTRPGGAGDSDIWVTQRASTTDPWGPPVNLGLTINTSSFDAVPSLSRDGHWLLFHSTRPGGHGDWDIWMAWRAHVHDDFSWQEPVNLPSPINTPYQDSGGRLFQGDSQVLLYFNSQRPDGMGISDIYVTELGADGTFGPVTPVSELNSPYFDNRPTIRADGLELIMFSDRVGTYGGVDLWTSTRETTFDPWSTPVNLGAVVNSTFVDFLPEMSSDRKTLYFASNRPGGYGGVDLYLSTRDRAR